MANQTVSVGKDIGDQMVISAGNCTIAVGLPLTRTEFEKSLKHSPDIYGAGFAAGWNQYAAQWLTPCHRFLNECMDLGVMYEPTDSLLAVKKCFDRREMRVLLLISHWHEGRIEWSGRFESIESLVACIQKDFDGVLDLCICHPKRLRELLDLDRPNCLIRYSTQEVDPEYWLPYFKGLFRLLNEGGYCYASAHEALNIAIARRTKEPQ